MTFESLVKVSLSLGRGTRLEMDKICDIIIRIGRYHE